MSTPYPPADDRPLEPVETSPTRGTQREQTKQGTSAATYVILILALLVIAAVIVFILQNTQPINVKFLSWHEHFSKSSVALGAAAVAGLIAGFFLGLIPWMSARRKLKAARHGR